MRDNARRMTEMHEKMGPAASMSAPERLDRMEKMTTGMMGMAQSTKAEGGRQSRPAGFGWG